MKYITSIVLIFALLPIQHARADDGWSGRQKRFIRELFSERRYFDAISEARRLSSYEGKTVSGREMTFFIDACYFLGGQYETVLKNIKSRGADRSEFRYRMLESQSLLMLGMRDAALVPLSGDYASLDSPLRRELLLRRTEIYSWSGDCVKMKEEIALYGVFDDAADLASALRACENPGLKSRGLAVGLSAVLPGLGQVYSGKYIAGLLTLAGVASTASAAYAFHRKGNDQMFYTMVFFSALFYAGGLYGAYNSAASSNEAAIGEFRREFKRRCVPDYRPERDIDFKRIFK
ncbi:MAG: hypothetical protein MUD12_04135 [Spirochaetes bacterium]|jgi:hypothetical protein|nr:hypothetical protein [Spirochaetota bacterium]